MIYELVAATIAGFMLAEGFSSLLSHRRQVKRQQQEFELEKLRIQERMLQPQSEPEKKP